VRMGQFELRVQQRMRKAFGVSLDWGIALPV
jgi:hypothetical protein